MQSTLHRALGALVFCLVLAASLPAQADSGSTARERIAELRSEIARHDELYFKRAAPEITDAEYDALKRELRGLLEQHPQLAAADGEAAAGALGDDRSGRFPTARHRMPMLGLEKSYSEAELRKFLARVERLAGEPVTWVVEPKYDGLAISLTYVRGRLVRAVTRGNGSEGDDVTANLLACTDVPRELPAQPDFPLPEFIELRGEVFMALAEFERVNAMRRDAGEEVFAHPRNLAVGTLKATDPAVLRSRRLTLVCYGWGACEPADAAPVSQRDLLTRLSAAGFLVPPAHVASGAETVWQIVRVLDRERSEFAGPLDGAVIKVDEVGLRRQLGEGEAAPRWAIAHKFEPERVETRLRAITWQVGRTGTLTPVAELDPVTLGGSTIARASLHNRREIERRDYRIGDRVRVERAGEIIPQLVGVNLAARPAGAVPVSFPTACPVCATALQPEGEAGWRCPQRACPAQVKRRLEHFASEAALNIRGLGPVLVETLVDRGKLSEVDGIYRLSGAEVPARVLDQIERSKGAELWRFVAGLGLPDVGGVNARKIADRAGKLEALGRMSREDLVAAGLSPAVAEAVARELASVPLQRILAGFSAAGVQPALAAKAASDGRLAGQAFVFTGTLRGLSREEAARRVLAAGGKVQADVARTTNYVVAGEGGGRKRDEAKRLGVAVLSEEEFLRMLEGK